MTRSTYRHTQVGKLWLFGVVYAVVVLVITVVAATVDDFALIGFVTALVGAVVVVIVIGIFSRLTVTVDGEEVKVAFGAGWPRKRISRPDIVDHRPVRNSWLLGFGIRWFKGGRLWNVWGLDAVELDLTNGKKFRIGTDEPKKLGAALSDAPSGRRR